MHKHGTWFTAVVLAGLLCFALYPAAAAAGTAAAVAALAGTLTAFAGKDERAPRRPRRLSTWSSHAPRSS